MNRFSKSVIATGWSGNKQYMDRTSDARVGYRLVDSHDPRGLYSGSVWAEPDVAEAAAQLRALAENSDARAALGGRARDFASDRLGGDGLAVALPGGGVGGPYLAAAGGGPQQRRVG